ncbi:HAD family hydrolase [Kineothrix sp. MB12-C1]|nr:HAD hydrolase family protein [Kineothrix sp. MB12-C1]WMC93908.1 HAD hydrolase family protein [Kineothrix sp. MB12-C1]
MLEYVGVGIAMGDAPEEVKKIADLVAGKFARDRVTIGLKQLRFI